MSCRNDLDAPYSHIQLLGESISVRGLGLCQWKSVQRLSIKNVNAIYKSVLARLVVSQSVYLSLWSNKAEFMLYSIVVHCRTGSLAAILERSKAGGHPLQCAKVSNSQVLISRYRCEQIKW